MGRALQSEGYHVFQAGDYTSGVAAFENHKSEINLLVVDVSLPGKNGCELARTLLSQKPDLRVLFISGHVGAEVVRFYGIDVTDLFFLRKPFKLPDLVKRVRRVLDSSAPLPNVIVRSRVAE